MNISAAQREEPYRKRGRKPSIVWSMVSAEGDNEMSNKVCNCRYCGEEVNHGGNAVRAAAHLTDCLLCPEAIRLDIRKIYPKEDPDNKASQGLWTSQDQWDFEALFSDFIYVNNFPFNIVNYELIQALIKKLNPHAKIPSADKLSTALLDASYQRVREERSICRIIILRCRMMRQMTSVTTQYLTS